jgi:hypothetical protein
MPYLIDGHNLIGALPGLHLSDLEDEQRLVELVQEFCQRSGKKAEVFFDNAAPGQTGARTFGRLVVRFARAGLTADAAIAQRLKTLGPDAANWTVVSSDAQVQAAGRRARARVLPSPQFGRELLAAAPGPSGSEDPRLSAGEVEDWLRLFDQGADDDG